MIENRKTSVTYRGDGNTTVFPFAFAISSADNIHVVIYDTATEVATEITRDYFVDAAIRAMPQGRRPRNMHSRRSCRPERISQSIARRPSTS